VPAYAQMIQAAALRRDVAAHAERIAGTQALPQLAQALIRQSAAYERLTAESPASSDPAPLAAAVDEAREAIGEWLRSPPGRAIREDWLLADLLQHPEQVRDLARILPDEAFTTPQRREVYRTLLTLGESGDPVDEVIVAWHLEQQRAIAKYYTGEFPEDYEFEPERTSPEPDVVYLSRLAATVTTVTAVEAARDLIADDLRAQLNGTAERTDPRAENGGPAPSGPQRSSQQPMPLDPERYRPQP
jgi:DnaB-like helicase N terminal domain